jgi:hypothetical protein
MALALYGCSGKFNKYNTFVHNSSNYSSMMKLKNLKYALANKIKENNKTILVTGCGSQRVCEMSKSHTFSTQPIHRWWCGCQLYALTAPCHQENSVLSINGVNIEFNVKINKIIVEL